MKWIIPLIIWFSVVESFEKVIIWGHKLHTHTHSYIHRGFYRAFVELGYPTYWFDDQDQLSNFDFSNALFLTEGQVDKNIPIRDDGTYIVHNVSPLKYANVKKICIQVYTNDVLSRKNLQKKAPFFYEDFESGMVYMPWATDLLPQEIEVMKARVLERGISGLSKQVCWIGSVGDGIFGNITELQNFQKGCLENGLEFVRQISVSDEQNKESIFNSYLAPAIVGSWQKEKGYIPCRIFKNISYGQLGITNSKEVYELFEKKIVYNPDTYQLFYDAKKEIEKGDIGALIELMDVVQKKHTYINRIEFLLEFIDQYYNSR